MKRGYILLLACLLFAGCGEKKEPSSSSDSAPPVAEDSAASKATPAASEESAEPAATAKTPALLAFKEIEKEFMDARNSFVEELRALPEDERGEFIDNNAPQPDEYVERFMKIAEDHPDDPAAVDALLWVAQCRVGGEAEEKAYGILMSKHVDNEKLGDLCFSLMYGEPSDMTETRLKALIEKSPHDEIKAKMTFALANYYQSNMKESGVDESEVLALFDSLGSEYGDFKLNERSRQTFAEMAKNSIFELQNLSVGKVAPDIEGEDLHGVEFKLSDYRGKVIVLDFWGDW